MTGTDGRGTRGRERTMTRASSVSQRRYANRREAGRLLASRLASLRTRSPIVLALPRGGVPVGAEIARALGAPLDVIVVRKLGVPFQPELGMGAVGEGGVRVVDEEIVAATHVTPGEFATVEERERVEVERRSRRYRGGRPMVSIEGQTVVVVDDGIATGGTVRAALKVARAHGAREVVLAVPVAPPDTLRALASDADDIVVLGTPQPFFGVGQWYEDFRQTSDDEVIALLQGARTTEGTVAEDDPRASDPTVDLDLDVEIGALHLPAVLNVPEHAAGLVVFAHGSGSSRHSPRNVLVAHHLQRRGLATLLFDLLTPDEAVDRANVFDVELLAVRLLFATRWTRQRDGIAELPLGYFGASTGAAAALWAAAEDQSVEAVVSRGGRPDLATARLAEVNAPTLFIVGGRDTTVGRLNEEAAAMLTCEHRLAIVRGATHLFDEPGTLEVAADLAVDWFDRHLRGDHAGS
jgi:putative phosphoribosyl transferase